MTEGRSMGEIFGTADPGQARMAAVLSRQEATIRSVRRVGAVFTGLYGVMTLVVAAAGASGVSVAIFGIITMLFLGGTAVLPAETTAARWAFALGGALGVPLGLVMCFQSGRLGRAAREVELARQGAGLGPA